MADSFRLVACLCLAYSVVCMGKTDVDMGWIVESAIPLTAFDPISTGSQWTFNVARYDYYGPVRYSGSGLGSSSVAGAVADDVVGTRRARCKTSTHVLAVSVGISGTR